MSWRSPWSDHCKILALQYAQSHQVLSLTVRMRPGLESIEKQRAEKKSNTYKRFERAEPVDLFVDIFQSIQIICIMSDDLMICFELKWSTSSTVSKLQHITSYQIKTQEHLLNLPYLTYHPYLPMYQSKLMFKCSSSGQLESCPLLSPAMSSPRTSAHAGSVQNNWCDSYRLKATS